MKLCSLGSILICRSLKQRSICLIRVCKTFWGRMEGYLFTRRRSKWKMSPKFPRARFLCMRWMTFRRRLSTSLINCEGIWKLRICKPLLCNTSRRIRMKKCWTTSVGTFCNPKQLWKQTKKEWLKSKISNRKSGTDQTPQKSPPQNKEA